MKERVLRNIFRLVVCTIVGAYALLLLILNFSPTEQFITHYVAQELSKKIGTIVSIENIEVGLFNRLTLNNIEIKDKNNKSLLKAQHVSAKIELRSLLKSQLSLRTVSLLDTDIQLYKQHADSAANYQFIIDAFSKKEDKKPSSINLRINSIILRRVNLMYDEKYKSQTLGTLNPAHLHLKNINANISLKNLTNKDVDLRVRSLALSEQSGLKLNKLTFQLKADKKHALLKDFCLELPHTRITQNEVMATYDIPHSFSDLAKTLSLDASINKARINTVDVRPFLKNFPRNLDETFVLSGDFKLTPRFIQVNSLKVNDSNHTIQLLAHARVTQKNSITPTRYSLNLKQLGINQSAISKVTTLIDKLSPKTIAMLHQLGDVECSGQLDYAANGDGKSSVVVQTAVGRLLADAKIQNKQVEANLQLVNAQPDVLLKNEKLPTNISLKSAIKADIHDKKQIVASTNTLVDQISWNKYTYKNISLKANYNKQDATVEVVSNDPNASFSAKADMNLNDKSLAQLHGDVVLKAITPSKLGFSTLLDKATISANIKANLSQLNKSLPRGNVSINQLQLINGKYGDYQLAELEASLSDVDSRNQQLQLQSDFANVSLMGDLSADELIDGVKSILHKSLPGLINGKQTKVVDKEWQINAQLKKTDFLYKLFGFEAEIASPLEVRGVLSTGVGRTHLTAYTDQLTVGGQVLGQPSIYISGKDSTYQCLVQAHKKISNRNYSISANLEAQNGELTTHVGWKALNYNRYNGEFKSVTRFIPHNARTTNFEMHILPTQFALADTLWNIASGRLSYIDKELSFSNVKLSHCDQLLNVNGRVAPNKNDSIVAQLNNIDIDYVLDLINFDAVSFGGQASGTAVFTQQNHLPQLHANLNIPNFTFNNGEMGNTNILANWNKKENRINLDAQMRLPHGENRGTNVQGYVSLAEKGLLLNIEAKNTRLQFLRRYIDGIFGNFDGEATGNVRLYGPFKALDFDGKVTADCQAKVLSTGVDYRVSDGEVVMTQGQFSFKDFIVYDKLGGRGSASGTLKHTHLKNLNYHFDLKADKLLCYDQPKSPDLPFYSRTVGSGSVSLNGWPSHFTADIMLTPNSPTSFVYDLGTQSVLSADDSMVRFHTINVADTTQLQISSLKKKGTDETAGAEEKHEEVVEKDDSGTDIVLNFFLNVNPMAQVRIITDDRSGDAITVYGNGALRASWHNKGSFDMYGTYTIDHGEYKINLQDIIRKNLNLQKGSSITFTGDPLNANLDLKALYTVNGVSLNDLNYSAGFTNKTVRADCILNIQGKAGNPQVDFDLDLHNISEDEKQMVRQLISTEEDMSKQVVCLLGMGRFLTANSNYASETSGSQQQSAAAMRSFVSTTLTGQLNNAINSILGNQSKWSFGTNFNPGDDRWNNMEVDGLLQGRLFNDRLLINGNFGYRDKPTYTSNFVGDFDIRYLLTPRGSVSLRAYSKTNDRYFTKSSLTTQGVGVMLQRDFNNLRELFNRRKKSKAQNK